MTKFSLAIVGCRHFENYVEFHRIATHLLSSKVSAGISITIVSGGAQGTDSMAARYAKEMGYTLVEFLPDWNKFGKSAGYKRNCQIVGAADAVLAFWDYQSKGTDHSITIAKRCGKPVKIVRVPPPQPGSYFEKDLRTPNTVSGTKRDSVNDERAFAGHFSTRDILFTENERAQNLDVFKREKEQALLQAAELLGRRIDELNAKPLERKHNTVVQIAIARAERNVAEARKRELSDFDRERIHRFRTAKELAGRLAEVLDSRETSSRGLLMNPWATRKWTTGKELVIRPASFKWAYHTNRHMTSKELDREIDRICDDIAFEREQAKA